MRQQFVKFFQVTEFESPLSNEFDSNDNVDLADVGKMAAIQVYVYTSAGFKPETLRDEVRLDLEVFFFDVKAIQKPDDGVFLYSFHSE